MAFSKLCAAGDVFWSHVFFCNTPPLPQSGTEIFVFQIARFRPHSNDTHAKRARNQIINCKEWRIYVSRKGFPARLRTRLAEAAAFSFSWLPKNDPPLPQCELFLADSAPTHHGMVVICRLSHVCGLACTMSCVIFILLQDPCLYETLFFMFWSLAVPR